jgi:cytochrome b561
MMNDEKFIYPTYAKLIHLGLAFFGIAAFLTGELAEDGGASIGYLIHSYLGLSLAFIIFIRIFIGFTSTQVLSFKDWSPFSKQQWKFALEDLLTLLSLQVPERRRHQGLAGLTQAFGLLIFFWMALTGTALFILGSGIESEAFEFVEEVHEVGESLIPLYLVLHIGGVIFHTLCGKPIWKKMFSYRSR